MRVEAIFMTDSKPKYLLIIGIGLFIISTPLIFTQPSVARHFNFSNTGQIGDTIGGITAPFINFLGAILVYFSFQQQIKYMSGGNPLRLYYKKCGVKYLQSCQSNHRC